MDYRGAVRTCWFVVTLLGLGYGYPTGAPDNACGSMMPNHDSSNPQSSTSPFTVSVPASKTSYSPLDTITVTISSAVGESFKGFMIQARADNNVDPIGSFTAISGTKKVCSNQGGLTHTDSSAKSSLDLVWTAPSTGQGDIKFVATVVKTKTVFWMNVESAKVTDPTGGSAPTQPPKPIGSTSDPISVSECGTSKGCLKVPQTCTLDCEAVVTWKDRGDNSVQMELGRKGEGWVGVAFSTDNRMGDDSVMECIRFSGSSAVSQSKNGDGKSNGPINNDLEGISDIKVGYINGQMVCSFIRQKTVVGRESDIFDLKKNYFFLLGTGDASSTKSKSQHGSLPTVSSIAMNVDENILATVGQVAPAIKAHGSMMIIAWVITASFGVLIARHYKQQWPGKTLFGKDIWFSLHVPAMLITLLLTIIAFIIIFVHAGGYSQLGNVNPAILRAHPVLGIIVTILAIINPIMAVFRPHPNTKRRPIFNWAHWGVGVTARILAIITIFLGLNLPSVVPTVPKYLTWVMVGFVAFYILVEIILELHKYLTRDRERTSNIELKSPGDPDPAPYASQGGSGCLFRSVMFGIIVAGLLTFGLILVIAVAKPQ